MKLLFNSVNSLNQKKNSNIQTNNEFFVKKKILNKNEEVIEDNELNDVNYNANDLSKKTVS